MTRQHTSRTGRRGSALMEFTLVGIPLMFTMIGIFEISRGMWNYHTLTNATKAGVRFAVVHGQGCDPVYHPSPFLNSCLKTVAQVAQVIQDAGVGLDVNTTVVNLRTVDASGTVTSTVTCNLRGAASGCQNNATIWPPNNGSNQKGRLIQIDLTTPFKSMIAMFWPGATPMKFAATQFPASSRDTIQF